MSVRRRESISPALLHPRILQRRAPRQNLTDQYKGYLPKENDEAPAREKIEDLDREKLWHEYISCRKPVVIDGLIQQRDWHGEQWKNPSFLRNIAGSTLVKIEPVDAVRDQFGTSAKRKIVQLSTFLDMLEDPELAGKWYMTTQYEDDDDDNDEEEVEEEEEEEEEEDDEQHEGPDELGGTNGYQENGSIAEVNIDERLLPKVDVDVSLPAPTDSLAHLFPLPGPDIMGNLVLQQCNLWMGNGKSGKSSGLHHDFHDNLYMLLSGRKRFLIWPPLAHRWLEPVGRVSTVHSNGLIEYDVPDQNSLQADGLTKAESALWLVRARMRALLVADEKAARLIGEEHVEKGMRKGKGKQTAEQEFALKRLREAEVDLYLIRIQGQADEEESELLSSLSSQKSSSDLSDDLFDRGEDYSDEDDDTTDEKLRCNDEDLYKEEASDLASSEEEDLPKIKRSKAKRTKSDGPDSQADEDSEDEADLPNKRHRRHLDKLIIPRGHLPGGLRGSLQDLEGNLDSGSDEFADENEDGGDIYISAVDDGDEDEEETILMTLEMRNRVLARMRDMVAGTDTSREELSDDELPAVLDRPEDTGSGSNADTEESWPSMDPDALEDGEAALEALARLQSEREGKSLSGKKSQDMEDDPKSFSRIPPKVIQWFFGKPFDPGTNEMPELGPTSDGKAYLAPREGCPAPIEIHLEAGQMLYLPASWYHEVTSYSDPEEKSGLHMALNYWFHPPTAIRRHTTTIQAVPAQTRGGSRIKANQADSSQPYLNGEVWDEIRRSVNKKIAAIRHRAATQQAKLS